jgi:hemerythrin-like domain-containing protein
MQVLSSLIEEHQFISRLVDALERCAEQVLQGAEVDPGDVKRFARVLNQFGDQIHHEKEERIVLPFITRHGFDWNAHPLPLIRQEHRQEQYLVSVLTQAGERLNAWSNEDRRHVAAAAQALCAFQRAHHRTENSELFPMILARIESEVLRTLESELALFDAQPSHQRVRAEATHVGGELIEQYDGCSLQLSAPTERG